MAFSALARAGADGARRTFSIPADAKQAKTAVPRPEKEKEAPRKKKPPAEGFAFGGIESKALLLIPLSFALTRFLHAKRFPLRSKTPEPDPFRLKRIRLWKCLFSSRFLRWTGLRFAAGTLERQAAFRFRDQARSTLAFNPAGWQRARPRLQARPHCFRGGSP
jgi:hypothetical protein